MSTGRDIDAVSGVKKRILFGVGKKALSIGSNRYGSVTRPVRGGLPHDAEGFGMLVKEAFLQIKAEPSESYIVSGIPYDPHEPSSTRKQKRDLVTRIITSAVKPHGVHIIPQAYGTLKACQKKAGTVINIGHGTTEIISIAEGGYPDGFSIDRAASFVTSQLDGGSRRESYVDHTKMFKSDPAATERLTMMLSRHIADDVARLKTVPPIILAGGGSQIPGMRKHFEDVLQSSVEVPENPIYANAMGYEIMARDRMNIPRNGLGKGAPELPASRHGIARMLE